MSKESALQIILTPFHWVDLSEQQRVAIHLAARGKPVSEIAQQMKIRKDSVKAYLRTALVKIRIHHMLTHDVANLSLRDLPDLHLTKIEEELNSA